MALIPIPDMLPADPAIADLVQRGLLPATRSYPDGEHPTASWLFRRWKPGAAILTKGEAYQIGNELNRLLARVRELEGVRR